MTQNTMWFMENTPSRFIRTTWLLSAVTELKLQVASASIRRISASESASLAENIRKRNVFARHAGENSFYFQRAKQLADTTVVEVFYTESSIDQAKTLSEVIEQVAFLSSVLGLRRDKTHNLLALSRHRRYGFDLTISPGFEYLSSSEKKEVPPRGISVDQALDRRFNRCGFEGLVVAATSTDGVSRRLKKAASWLFESRLEMASQAAVVKTAIALESLLIASDSESLRGPLSERTAFLLSDEPAKRRRIAKSIKAFYDLRSSIVHGGRKSVSVTPTLLEGVDRLVLLLLLTISANTGSWQVFKQVIDVVEDRKWGDCDAVIHRPYSGSHLTRALLLCERVVA